MSRSTLPIPVESAMDQLLFEHEWRFIGGLSSARIAQATLRILAAPACHLLMCSLWLFR